MRVLHHWLQQFTACDVTSRDQIITLLSRTLQALSDPYCQLTCLSVCLSVCLQLSVSNFGAKYHVQQGVYRKVPTARQLVMQ